MKDVLEGIGIVIVAVFIVSYLMWRVEREKNTPRTRLFDGIVGIKPTDKEVDEMTK